MVTLRIHDVENHVLAVGLYDLLILLAPRSLNANWIVSTVKCDVSGHEWFDATDIGGDDLEALAKNDNLLSGFRLAEIAMKVRQVIWGRFAASLDAACEPWVAIQAIDSTFYEVTTSDQQVISAIRSRYRDVREVDGPYRSFGEAAEQDHS
jgi:hypothetical protein